MVHQGGWEENQKRTEQKKERGVREGMEGQANGQLEKTGNKRKKDIITKLSENKM